MIKAIPTQEVEQGDFSTHALTFLKALSALERQRPSIIKHAQVERIRAEVQKLRIKALEAKLRADFPDIEIDYDLLDLVGIDEDIPVEKERELLGRVLEELHGHARSD